MSSQSETEIAIFIRFVELAKLDILPESVEKRQPPEPDIRCRYASADAVAFEMVEVCNPKNSRFMFNAKPIHNALLAAHTSLPSDARAAFTRRFGARPMRFYFKPEASVALIRGVLPRLLTELSKAAPFENECARFSPRVSRAVDKVVFAGRYNDTDVNFNLGGHYDSWVPLEAIEAKLERTYITDSPVELLAHFGANAWGSDESFRERVSALLQTRGLGPFRRIWLMEWEGIGLVYPPHQPCAAGAP
jgi:hypothetical protein